MHAGLILRGLLCVCVSFTVWVENVKKKKKKPQPVAVFKVHFFPSTAAIYEL